MRNIPAFLVLVAVAIPSAWAAERDANSNKGVTAVLDMQVDAWNRGDLETFMTGYLKSPNMSFTSGGEEFWGYDTLQQRYAKSYGTNRDTMGKLKFSDLKVVDVGKDGALCVGHWHLERKDKPLAEGIFSLVFVRESTGWKIIHDHTTAGLKKADERTAEKADERTAEKAEENTDKKKE